MNLGKSMEQSKTFYFLYYVYEYEDGHEDIMVMGVFSTRKKAKEALEKICNLPELKKAKRLRTCLEIDKRQIGRLGWEDGFFTVNC